MHYLKSNHYEDNKEKHSTGFLDLKNTHIVVLVGGSNNKLYLYRNFIQKMQFKVLYTERLQRTKFCTLKDIK